MEQNIQDLIERATNGNYEVHGEPKYAECLIGFSFGYKKLGDKILPGLSNTDLAEFISNNYSSLPKILQFEIADALTDCTGFMHRIEKHRETGTYLNTLEVAIQAKEIMDKHQWGTALLIAHPYHMPRVDAVCQKLGIKTIVPPGLESVKFDTESEQEWTRDQAGWTQKEPKSITWYADKDWL